MARWCRWRDWPGNITGYALFVDATSGWALGQGSGSGSVLPAVMSTVGYAKHTWAHVVGTYDGAALRLYVNGTLVAGPLTSTISVADNSSGLLLSGSGSTSLARLHRRTRLSSLVLPAGRCLSRQW